MVGGDEDAVAVEPALDAWPRRTATPTSGLLGAGHFVKMVHNGIEYGLMQAYAEGFEVMNASEFDLDLQGDRRASGATGQRGPVVASRAPGTRPSRRTRDLERVAGYVEDSGEGRWTVLAAIDEDVPAPVISAALFARFASRQDESFAAKVIAALRRSSAATPCAPSRSRRLR